MKLTSTKYFFLFVSLLFFSTQILQKEKINNIVAVKKSVQKETLAEKLQTAKDRDEYFFQLMRDPKTNTIPFNIRIREIEYAKTLPKGSGFFYKTNREGFKWTEVGPRDVGGRTRALAVDVNNSKRVLAGGVSGGIWETTDKGSSWRFLSSSTSLLSVTSIVQDPRDGHTDTWYFAAGEYYGNSASLRGSPFRGNGIYKSTDNGITWTALPNTVSDPSKFDSDYDYVSKIIVSPTTGSVFIASNTTGILRSTDGGDSFTLVLGGKNDHLYSDVAVANNGMLIASISQKSFNDTQHNQPGIYKSTDDGENWTNITPADFPETHERTVLAIAESNPNTVYVLTNTGKIVKKNDRKEEIVKFFKLNIADGTSQNLTNNLPTFSSYKGSITAQTNYDLVLAVKPDDENFVLIGATSLFRSTDGFATKLDNKKLDWIGGYNPDGGSFYNHHPDQHIIVFDKNDPNRVWSGHDGGISYTYDITETNYSQYFTWITKNKGYNVTQFYTVNLDKTKDDKKIMGGAQDNGTPSFTYSNGIISKSVDISSGDGSFCYFGKNYAYVSSQYGRIIRLKYASNGSPIDPFSSSSGWSDVFPKNASGQIFVNPFCIDPNNENIMYYPSSDTLWRNNNLSSIPDKVNHGTTIGWEKLPNIEIPDGYFISAMKVSTNNPQHLLYLGLSNNNDKPKLIKIANADTAKDGETDISIADAPSGARIQDIAINPNNGNEILVVMSNYNIVGLYHSSDAGANFTAVEGNLIGDDDNPGPSLRSAIIMPFKGDNYYFVGTSTGLYLTTTLDGSNTTWVQEGADVIGNVIVQALDARISDHTVAVATHGRGIFLGTPNGPLDVQNNTLLQNGFVLSQNYPNPFNPTTTIKYIIPSLETLHATSPLVRLKVYDILGKEVATLVNEKKSAGEYEVSFNAAELASGIYYYTLSVGNFSETKKMILLK